MSAARPAEPSQRVAIIGGGISGLAAAHRLLTLRPDVRLTLIESQDRLGGSLETARTGDLLVERGADSFISTPSAAVDLCHELGLQDALIPTNSEHRGAMVVSRGKPQKVPEGFVLMAPHKLAPVWRSPVLSFAGKLRLMMEPWIRRPKAALEPDYDESVGSFARRRLGWEAYERLAQPLIAGIYVADAERLSLAATQPKFLQAERDHGSLGGYVRNLKKTDVAHQSAGARYAAFQTLRGGVSQLVSALAAELPAEAVALNTAVAEVRQSASSWMVDSSLGPREFDGVIVTTAAPHAAALLRTTAPGLSHALDAIHHASSAVIAAAYPTNAIRRPVDAFGIVVPAMERRRIVAVSCASQKFPGRAPDDVTLLRVFLGGVLQPDLVDAPDDELLEIAQSELQALIGVDGQPLLTDVKRWRQAMPQYEVGHVQHVDQIEERVTRLPGLQLAGNAYRGVGIPHCIAYARSAAERLHAQLPIRRGD